MGFTRFDNVICSECRRNSNNNTEYKCAYCGECLDYQRPHCHNTKTGDCKEYIKDCQEHWEDCKCESHEDCKCQNP